MIERLKSRENYSEKGMARRSYHDQIKIVSSNHAHRVDIGFALNYYF